MTQIKSRNIYVFKSIKSKRDKSYVGKETRISKKITSDLTNPCGKDPLIELLN